VKNALKDLPEGIVLFIEDFPREFRFRDFHFQDPATYRVQDLRGHRRRRATMKLFCLKANAVGVGACVLSLCLSQSALPQLGSLKRNIYQDSIAWVAQPIPIPGVVAGDAIWFDYNNDGRLDIVMAGMSADGPVSGIFRNDSTAFVDVHAQICSLVSERGLAWGDFDNDGDYDLAIEGRTDTYGQMVSKIYRNDNGTFVDIHAPLMNLMGGSVTWVDYDNDGRLDLFMTGSPDGGSSFVAKLYRNMGGEFLEQPVPFPGVWGSSVGWGDYDNDGDLDLLICGYGYGRLTRLFRNDLKPDSGATFVEISNPVFGGGPLEEVNSGALTWFDYDNDGSLDVLITGTGWSGAVAKIFHNNYGTFTDVGANLSGVAVSAVAIGDYDNDGFLDIAISGSADFWFGSNPTTRIYHNNNDGTFTDIGANLIGTWFGSLEWGDYDRDGRLDLLVTGGTIGRDSLTQDGRTLKPVTMLYRNTVPVDSNKTPTVPSGLSANTDGDRVTFSWNPSSDYETAQKAISYNMRIGKTTGGIDVVSPLSNVNTGFRRTPKLGNIGNRTSAIVRNLPAGTYYWSVQAVDNQYGASHFTPEGTFSITSSSTRDELSLPKAFTLRQNFPNPFNPATTIGFALPKASFVTLKVYDILGREIAVLLEGRREAGEYTVQWNPGGCSSGVYFCRMQSGSFIDTKEMILVR
jgi:hypothetical protein